MSFFDDEPDEPTRVTRPARPRTAGGARTATIPAPEELRRRRAVALAVGAVLLILLLLLVKGCVNSRHDNALKDYNRNVASIVDSSDQQVSKQLFDVLDGGGSANDVQVAVNQVRLVAEEDVKRAKALSAPGDAASAQRNLELVLNLRAAGVRRIADLLPTALSTQAGAGLAIRRIAGQMEAFLASDVVYSQRVAPLIQQALNGSGITGQTIATSKFLPSIGWLDPAQVATRMNPGASGGAATTNGQPAPGTHGHGLISVKAGAITLQPGQVVNRIPATSGLSFDTTIANQGQNDETNVTVTLKVSGSGTPIAVKKRLNQTKAGTNATVTLTLPRTPPIGKAVTIDVSVAPVPGEKKTDNNKQSYTALFTG